MILPLALSPIATKLRFVIIFKIKVDFCTWIICHTYPEITLMVLLKHTNRLGWIFLCSCAKQVIIIIITHWFFANLIRTRWWLNDYFFMWNYLETLRQQAITSVLHGWNSTKQSKSYGKQKYVLYTTYYIVQYILHSVELRLRNFLKLFCKSNHQIDKVLSRTFMSPAKC